ncbi:MAG: ABC transporter ATP-binding protein [Planctomycetota bacterium]
MALAISVRQLAVTFGRGQHTVPALLPLDLEVQAGAIVGVLGPNSSGKTTLLRVLAGLQRPSGGEATILGEAPDSRANRNRVAFQSEGLLPLGVLSAPRYLQWVGAELGLPNALSDARAAALLDRLGLRHAGARALRTFSTGMQKRLALAAALLGEPAVLLLDEPTAGLDPFGSETVMAILCERAAAGGTVLLASHHLLEVEEICDEVVLLHRGALRARGRLADLLATDEQALVVRGLTEPALGELAAAARARGGAVQVEGTRQHLFALFRRLGSDDREVGR